MVYSLPAVNKVIVNMIKEQAITNACLTSSLKRLYLWFLEDFQCK